MPANLQLLPRKEFIITLSGGEQLSGKFGTWAAKRFCEKRNIGLNGMLSKFLTEQKNEDGSVMKNEKGEPVYDIIIGDMVDYIICALEYGARIRGEKFTLTDVQFCEWIDDYGYDTGKTGVLTEIYLHSASEEKKSESLNNLVTA